MPISTKISITYNYDDDEDGRRLQEVGMAN